METQCGIGKPITQKLHGRSWTRWMLVGKIVGHLLTFSINQHVLLRVSLRLGSVFFRVSCTLVGGEQFGLLGCLCGLSVSQQAHMGERLLSELAASQTPWGPDRLSNLSSWKSQPDGGRDGSASGNLTTCLPVLHLPLPPPRWLCSPLLPRVQQGELYRPKGRLTSPESWNRSD